MRQTLLDKLWGVTTVL